MRIADKSLAYALLRVSLGINFAGHGLIRIHNGIAAFAQTTAPQPTRAANGPAGGTLWTMINVTI